MFLLSSVKVMHRNLKSAYDHASDVIRRARAGIRQVSGVFGPSRSSKTVAINMLVEDNPEFIADGKRVRPVILINTPVRPTKKTMAEAFLDVLDYRKTRQSADQATARVKFLLRAAETRVVIFDEIQHVAERNSEKSSYEIGDWLKTLADECDLSLLFFGLPAGMQLIDQNGQLRNRASPPFYLQPYEWAVAQDRKEFLRCLVSVEKILRERDWQLPSLTESMRAQQLYAASAGRYGMVVKLMECAMDIVRDTRSITDETLYEAYEQSIISTVLSDNPFGPDITLTTEILAQCYKAVINECGLNNNYLISSSARKRVTHSNHKSIGTSSEHVK